MSSAPITRLSNPEVLRRDQPAGGARVESLRGRLLQAVVALLDANGIPHCILHGHHEYPARVKSDVDCIIPAEFLPRPLAALLRENRDRLGADLVQWIQHESTAHYFVLATAVGAQWEFLAVDASSDYRRNGRVFYGGEEILSARRQERGFWVPAPAHEFGCYLVKKIAKRALSDNHGRRLTQLYYQDPSACKREIARFWRGESVSIVGRAAASGDWRVVQAHLSSLRRGILWPRTIGELWSAGRYWAADAGRRLRRWRAPTGVHVVLLGPDGSGKTSIVSALGAALAPGFRRVAGRHFAPALFRRAGASFQIRFPHSRRPRSLMASLAKAAYWALDYTLGYCVRIRPALARSTLVLFDRYLVDALVDPKRYRYGGPRSVLRLVWSLVPKPDVVIVLDAPAQVLQARKQEVLLRETERQRLAYRALAGTLPNWHIVDAALPFDQVVTAAGAVVLEFMTSRTARRLMARTASPGTA